MPSLTRLRRDALAIFDAGLKGADPVKGIRQHVRRHRDMLDVVGHRYDLSAYRNIYVVGAGKASARMALVVEELLANRISRGLVNVKHGYSVSLKKVKVYEAGHPLPDKAGVESAKEIASLLEQADDRDLVLCLISGGGSALLTHPADGLTLQDKQKTTQALLTCGAKIQEVNAVRKHISKVKGGRLAKLAYPATVISLILSDVIGDPIDGIASGPTAPDTSTFLDALHITERYGVGKKIPAAVRNLLAQGAKGEIEETPKADDPIFQRVQNVIVGNNQQALHAAKRKAKSLGYHSLVLTGSLEGEARKAGGILAAVAKDIIRTGNPIARPACVISGGETTVTIRGEGLGGRNQELGLAAAVAIDGLEDVVILSGATDGTDGPTDAAGAMVDGATLRRAREKGLDALDYLQRNNSYHFLQAVRDQLITGPTLTNVMDVQLVLVGERPGS